MPPGVTFVAISGGFQWSLALDSTGNAWAWGSNTEGELGNGLGNPTNAPNPVPVPVMMPAGVTFSTVVAGGYFGVALDTAGKAWAWGYNYEGELGNGTTNQNGTDCFCSTTPAAVTMPAGVTFSNVSAGGFFTVALDSGGNAWAWGYNGQGELGNGATTDSAFPVQVTIPVDVTFRAIAAGTFGTHALALDTTGNAWGWGNNNTGDVGDGTTIIRTLPVMTSMPAGVTFAAVAAGGHHSLALVSALPMSVPATVLTWGDGNDGQTGNPAFGFGSITAIPLNSLTDITAVAGGGYHTVALKSDGTVWNWGCPDYPCSRNTDNLAPVQVPSLTEITSISAGFYFALALKSDGTVWAWGNNGDGQLGNGTTTDSLTPVEVMFPSGVTITSIAAGGFHGLAIDSTGLVWAWGYGGDGQLGNGTMGVGGVTSGDSSVPVPSLMTGATAIAGGYFSSYALKSDGTVWAWGYNGKGELGNGSTTGAASNSSTPSQVMGLTGVTAIAAGRGEFGDHAMALKSDGSVWGWGDNDWGQLGVGTNSGPEVCGGGFYCSSTPVQVTGLTNIITIGCGGHHGMATKSDGTVWAWGENSFGELGDGTATERDTPIQVLALSGVVALSPGDDHSVALGPPPPEIPVVSIVSRKNHSAAGTFDIDLTNGSGVECRSAGSNGSYMLIFKFANPLMNYTRADVTDGTATIASTFIANNDAHNAIVNLTGVTNAQVVTVTLGDVTDSAGDYSSSVAGSMGVLLGDVNGSRRVDAADVSSVRQQTLQTIDATNFRNDINASGRIDASDVSIARQQTLTSLP
jgi:alpha-tubulin suppressor-like RCC1 family protein